MLSNLLLEKTVPKWSLCRRRKIVPRGFLLLWDWQSWRRWKMLTWHSLASPMPGWHFNSVAACWIGISSAQEISGFLWKDKTTMLPKILEDVRCGGFSFEAKLNACDRTAHPVPLFFLFPKAGIRRSRNYKSGHVTSRKYFSQAYMLQCPIFWKPWDREWTCEGCTCYVLTNTDSQKLYFLLIESRGCETTFYSRTWGSKHWLIVEQLNLAMSQSRNNDRIWKWMGEAVINLALK